MASPWRVLRGGDAREHPPGGPVKRKLFGPTAFGGCMHRFLPALAHSVALLSGAPAVAAASGVAYPDADWSEAWIPSSDGVTLHADVLRPKVATDATKTPVVVSIGPYFNHSGQTGPVGPA